MYKLVDGTGELYDEYEYQNEAEYEKMIVTNSELIFGSQGIYFDRCYSTYKDLILDRRLTLSLSNRIMDLTHEEPYAKQRHSRII